MLLPEALILVTTKKSPGRVGSSGKHRHVSGERHSIAQHMRSKTPFHAKESWVLSCFFPGPLLPLMTRWFRRPFNEGGARVGRVRMLALTVSAGRLIFANALLNLIPGDCTAGTNAAMITCQQVQHTRAIQL